MDDEEPTMNEAKNEPGEEIWTEATDAEIAILQSSDRWDVLDPPNYAIILYKMYTLKIKGDRNLNKIKYKCTFKICNRGGIW